MKLTALIIDDELNCRENLSILIEEFCTDVNIIGKTECTKEAREIIKSESPDIVFLDIKMPEEDGFTFLKSLKEKNFSVIFTTAHDQYALKAFRESAIDYLEKPISIDELQRAVEKVKKMHGSEKSTFNPDKILEIKNLLQSTISDEKLDKITIPTRDGFQVVSSEDIIRLEANENYTTIYLTGDRKFLSSKTIKTYEEKLNDRMFFRTHKSHIINILHHLKEFNRNQGNIAILSNGSFVPVSRRKLPEFLNKINAF